MLRCGIAPDYVLDRMTFYEVSTLLENLWMKEKESWEQTRTVAFVTAQSQSTKKLDMKSMMTFPWEKDFENEEISEEERAEILREMKEMEQKMNKK